jgi:hypothetical protein
MMNDPRTVIQYASDDDFHIPSVEEMDALIGLPPRKSPATAKIEGPGAVGGLNKSSPIISEKMSGIEITHGLLSSNKLFATIPLEDIPEYLTARTDCYERTSDAGPNRVYVDLDGAAIGCSQSDFDELVENIATGISLGLKDEHSLMSASHYHFGTEKKNKLSFRLTLLKKHGSKSAIKEYVFKTLLPQLSELLADYVPVRPDKECDKSSTYIGVDSSVYTKGRKMRMWNTSKDGETRPNVLWDAAQSPEDTLITHIPEDSEALPEPAEPLIVVRAPKPAEDDSDSAETGDPDAGESVLLRKVIAGLSDKRMDCYDDWIRIGIICFNEGAEFDVWFEASKRSKHFQAGTRNYAMERWTKFKKGNLTIATLWKMLKADNPAVYAELLPSRTDFWTLIQNANHAETARFFYNQKPDAYAYNDSTKWYQLLPTGAWKHYDKMPPGMMNDINITLKLALKEAQACLDFTSTDEREKERIKQAVAFGKNIGMASFVSGVISFLPANYNDPDLNTKMDESRHLFAFADKVVDLDSGITRPIKPSDYICLTTGYNAPTTSDPAIRADIQKVLYSIWEDAGVVEYVMKVIALQLHGRKRFEEFYVWTGRGGNGKGLLSALISRAFTEAKSPGDPGYFHTLPHTCLTKSQDKTDAPNPPIAHAKGKRFVQAQEPESEDKLRAGIIKELTGGDTIVARALYCDPVSYVPQFGLFLQCNGVPKLNKLDGGIKRRMVVINFPHQFVETPTEAHHRPIDMDLKDKITKSDAYRAEFVLMLLETFKTIGSTIEKPAFVKAGTDEYLAENDQIKEWLLSNYTLNKDPTDRRFKLLSEEVRQQFITETKTQPSDMSAQKFKTLMEMNGVVQKRESHSFKGFEWDEDAMDYVEADCRAGVYLIGLERKHE